MNDRYTVAVPFNLYSFKAAVILDAVFYSSIHLAKRGLSLWKQNDSDKIIFFRDNKKLETILNRGYLNCDRTSYMPGVIIESNGEIALSMTYVTLKDPIHILTELTSRKKANLINAYLKSSSTFILKTAMPVTSEWGLKPITIEDIEITRDIIQNEAKAVAKYGVAKVSTIKGKPLDPFLSSFIEMKYEELEQLKAEQQKKTKEINWGWKLRSDIYQKWIAEMHVIKRKIIKIHHQIIQILIDTNDQENLIKNKATA